MATTPSSLNVLDSPTQLFVKIYFSGTLSRKFTVGRKVVSENFFGQSYELAIIYDFKNKNSLLLPKTITDMVIKNLLAWHISLDLNVRGCVKFDSILMRNVTKIGVSSSFGVLGSIKQKLIFLTQNQLHKVIFLESGKTQSKILFHRPLYNLILVRIRHLEYSLSQLLLSFGHKIALIESAISI